MRTSRIEPGPKQKQKNSSFNLMLPFGFFHVRLLGQRILILFYFIFLFSISLVSLNLHAIQTLRFVVHINVA